MPFKFTPLFLFVCAVVFPPAAPAVETVADPTLLALYDFTGTDGATIRDRSGHNDAADLRIADLKAVTRTPGALQITGNTTIVCDKTPARVADAIRASGAITLEAWAQPANVAQEGPARILTLSKDTSNRNFTLGQEKDQFDVRLRTSKTDKNGNPSTASPRKSLTTQLAHIVYIRDRSGRTALYLDGIQSATGNAPGELDNWDRNFKIALGNEITGERPWRGTLHRVAIYSRPLSSAEIEQRFEAGPGSSLEHLLSLQTEAENAALFTREIAPILAEHCLECHDTANKKGKLDLSLKPAALAGGKHGKAIVAGNLKESLLWEAVESEEMPEDRDPLTKEEKESIKKWIEGGAVFATESVDPLAHKRDQRAAQNFVRRLTIPEYIATVKAATGVDIEMEAREILPPDMRADGFSNTAYNLGVDLKHVESYAKLAEIIVSKLDPVEFAGRFSKNRSLTDKPMIPHIAAMGKWLLRGPLDDRETALYRGISTSVSAAGGDFKEAVGFIIEAMLQSPRFIYQIENQRGDGSAQPVGNYELASRLSYIIWGASPDTELFDAAEKNQLGDSNKLSAQIDRMLKDPRAVDRSLQFIDEWLNLGRLANMRPNPEKFPDWTPKLAADMRQETLAYFREITWVQKRPLSDLFNAQLTFLTPELAQHYGIDSQIRPDSDLQKISLESVPSRGGLLTHGSILTMGGDDASMVTRGLFVLQDILRSGVTDPPPGTDTTPVPSKPGLTQRGAALERIANSDCGKCHQKFEPLAFGLEKFDGVGAFNEKDRFGNLLREDGEILFPGTAEPVPYKSSAELMDILAESPRVAESLTYKLAQFAIGRPLVGDDEQVLKQVYQSAKQTGFTYQSLIKAIAESDLVTKTRTEQ